MLIIQYHTTHLNEGKTVLYYLNGTVQEQHDQAIILSVGFATFQIFVPAPAAFTIGSTKTVYTYLHWHQDQGPILYGFDTIIDKALFELITSCSGIGPKIGLNALAALGAEVCIEAIQTENKHTLSKVSGLGTKKAEQLLLHLKDKISPFVEQHKLAITTTGSFAAWHTLSQALESLNYSRSEISDTLAYLKKASANTTSFDVLLRQALHYLAKQA